MRGPAWLLATDGASRPAAADEAPQPTGPRAITTKLLQTRARSRAGLQRMMPPPMMRMSGVSMSSTPGLLRAVVNLVLHPAADQFDQLGVVALALERPP